MPTNKQQEIENNYRVFLERLPSFKSSHAGKFALMRDGEIVEFFDTVRDAFVTGQRLFSDGLFSIQEVVDSPVDLGFYSHAVP